MNDISANMVKIISGRKRKRTVVSKPEPASYDKYMRYPEAAEFTKLSISTLKQKVMKNQIPHIKVGRAVVFNVDELDKWLEDQIVKRPS